MARIAIIGWGSLIWDLDDLTGKVSGGWQMGAGPRLSMEFSRISAKRKMGLAVCLDPEFGLPCATHAIRSRRGEIHGAIADLAARERTTSQNIGALCLESGHCRSRFAAIRDAVAEWAGQNGWDGAVWTDLPSNYAEMREEPFSVPGAERYLLGLIGESRDEAVRYITNAPETTDTPLRRHLAGRDWWRNEQKRVAARDAQPLPAPGRAAQPGPRQGR